MCVRAWLKDSCIALLCCYLLLSHCNWQMSDHIMYLIHFAAVNRCNYVQRILTYKVVFPGIRCDDVYTALDILKTRYRLCKLTCSSACFVFKVYLSHTMKTQRDALLHQSLSLVHAFWSYRRHIVFVTL